MNVSKRARCYKSLAAVVAAALVSASVSCGSDSPKSEGPAGGSGGSGPEPSAGAEQGFSGEAPTDVGPTIEAKCSSGAGLGDCDNNPDNGCETSLISTSNCGECGRSCEMGSPCEGPGGDTTSSRIRMCGAVNVMSAAKIVTLPLLFLGNRIMGLGQSSLSFGSVPALIVAGRDDPADEGYITLPGGSLASPRGLAGDDSGAYILLQNYSKTKLLRFGADSDVEVDGFETVTEDTGVGLAQALALHGNSFYIAGNKQDGKYNIISLPKSGGKATELFSVTSQSKVATLATDPTGSKLVWRETSGRTLFGSTQGSSAGAPVEVGNSANFAVDGTHVYWIEPGKEGHIRRISYAVGAVAEDIASVNDPTSIVLDEEYIYYVSRDVAPTRPKEFRRRKDGTGKQRSSARGGAIHPRGLCFMWTIATFGC